MSLVIFGFVSLMVRLSANVYADPATGIAYAADGGGFELMKWKVITNVWAGGLGIMSPYISIS